MWFLVPQGDRGVVLVWMIAPTLLIAAFTDIRGLGWMTRTKLDRDTPGILAFELAGREAASEAIVRTYRDRGLTSHAIIALWADFLFILGYSLTIGLACLITAEALRDRGWGLAWAGVAVAGAVSVAGVLDVVENAALLRILYDGVARPFPLLASLCAGVKFALLLAGLLSVGVGGLLAGRYALAAGGLVGVVLLAGSLIGVLRS